MVIANYIYPFALYIYSYSYFHSFARLRQPFYNFSQCSKVNFHKCNSCGASPKHFFHIFRLRKDDDERFNIVVLTKQTNIDHCPNSPPPPISEISMAADCQLATWIFRLWEKYRPETWESRPRRKWLRKRTEKHNEDKEDRPTERLAVVRSGGNTITALVESKMVQLAIISLFC